MLNVGLVKVELLSDIILEGGQCSDNKPKIRVVSVLGIQLYVNSKTAWLDGLTFGHIMI